MDHNKKAAELFATFTESEKGLCLFGIFPFEACDKADAEGFDSRLLAVALMDQAAEAFGGSLK